MNENLNSVINDVDKILINCPDKQGLGGFIHDSEFGGERKQQRNQQRDPVGERSIPYFAPSLMSLEHPSSNFEKKLRFWAFTSKNKLMLGFFYFHNIWKFGKFIWLLWNENTPPNVISLHISKNFENRNRKMEIEGLPNIPLVFCT